MGHRDEYSSWLNQQQDPEIMDDQACILPSPAPSGPTETILIYVSFAQFAVDVPRYQMVVLTSVTQD
jgi:hypothetical protein